MDEHTVLENLGNLGVVLLAVLLSTSVHYLFLKHLNRGARLTAPPLDQPYRAMRAIAQSEQKPMALRAAGPEPAPLRTTRPITKSE